MKETLRFLLARHPWLYRAFLGTRGDADVTRRVLLRLVEDGDEVLDVGADVGRYALLLSHRVGPHGRVTAFEPLAESAGRLEARLAAYGRFDNVRVVRAAVSDADGAAEIHQPGDDHGHASLRRHRHGAWSREAAVYSRAVPVIALDGWARSRPPNDPGRPALIKMDVEGAELPALRGAVELLTAHRPLLYLEVYARWTETFGYRPAELTAFLAGLGYDRWLRAARGEIEPLPAGLDAQGLGRRLAAAPQNLLCWRSENASHRRRVGRLTRSATHDPTPDPAAG